MTETITYVEIQQTVFSVVMDEDALCENDVQLHLPIVSLKQTERCDVTINYKKGTVGKNRLQNMLQQCSYILTNAPRKADLITHCIKLTDDQSIRVKPYSIPYY